MDIMREIDKKEIGYWDFRDFKNGGIHKISSYPATMVSSMQNELIYIIKQEQPEIKTILDPFHGSGVTLVEGKKNNLKPMGIDINPLASLITKVKLQGVDKDLIKEANCKIQKIMKDDSFNYVSHKFPGIEKWYRSDIIESFSRIRAAIMQETVLHIRQYYWVCLIDILKKYSNTRSSTFKLHVKKLEDIEVMENTIEDEFLSRIKEYFDYLPGYTKEEIDLQCGKAEELLRRVKDNSVDLICSSPPYGDNATTVTYGEYSILPLYWIDRTDLGEFNESVLDTYSGIDAHSLGGRRKYKESYEAIHSHALDKYLMTISEKKRGKVRFFVEDYLCVMEQLARVLKQNGYIVLTLGNRRVDNKVVPLVEITEEFYETMGIATKRIITRNIPKKRMPRKVSKVGEDSVESMNQEFILILRKEE